MARTTDRTHPADLMHRLGATGRTGMTLRTTDGEPGSSVPPNPPAPPGPPPRWSLARLPWPWPALLVWAGAWAMFVPLLLALRHLPFGAVTAMVLATLGGACCHRLAGGSPWRRALIVLGFPLSLVLLGAVTLPAWGWLIPLGVGLALYPMRAWRDAPVFPTPRAALQALAPAAPLAPGAVVLDAGCGLGHGLRALRRAYPQAALHGVEWSRPLWAWCALRCPWARVQRGDLWRTDWSGCALVYVFQRPESMARIAAKARTEMAGAGGWLASLEFAVPGELPHARLDTPDGRPLWLYRIGPLPGERPGSRTSASAGKQPAQPQPQPVRDSSSAADGLHRFPPENSTDSVHQQTLMDTMARETERKRQNRSPELKTQILTGFD